METILIEDNERWLVRYAAGGLAASVEELETYEFLSPTDISWRREAEQTLSGDPNQATAKDLDILKIEIYSERIHTRYSTTLSTSFAVFVGFIVILYTLLHDDLLILRLAVGVLTAGTLFEIYRIRAGCSKNFARISELIEMTKEGNVLPRLEDL